MKNNKKWIEACEETQRRLEQYETFNFDKEWHTFGECTICDAAFESLGDNHCRKCPIDKGGFYEDRSEFNGECAYLKLIYEPDTPHILALWLWLEDLKGMLKRGEL